MPENKWNKHNHTVSGQEIEKAGENLQTMIGKYRRSSVMCAKTPLSCQNEGE
jgi:hypothetical protein